MFCEEKEEKSLSVVLVCVVCMFFEEEEKSFSVMLVCVVLMFCEEKEEK